jgi:hypothetical protein
MRTGAGIVGISSARNLTTPTARDVTAVCTPGAQNISAKDAGQVVKGKAQQTVGKAKSAAKKATR